MLLCELDGRVLRGMQFGVLVLLCELNGRVLRGMQFAVLVDAVWGAGGCCFASLTAGC